MNCPNCNTPNADGEQFCVACGIELAGAVPTPAPAPDATQSAAQPVQTQAPPPIPSIPAIATLSFGGQDFPLHEGAKFVIARKDTDECKPDLSIDAKDVSLTPVEVTVQGGVITIRDTGTSNGMRVVKYVNPGGSMEVVPGDMLMLGSQVITIA